MTEPQREEGIDLIPRVHLFCATDRRHLSVVLIGTPLVGPLVKGLPARCPLCDSIVEWGEPPSAVEIEWAPDDRE